MPITLPRLKLGQTGTQKHLNSVIASIETALNGVFTGTLPIAESDVTSLVADLAAKAPLASPALTGNPTAPTQAAADSSTKLASTAFVQQEKALVVYTVATLPTAGAPNVGKLVKVTDGGAGSPCIAWSDGTNWKVVANIGATCAAS